MYLHGNLRAVEEANDGRQEEVHVVAQVAAELLQRRQKLPGHAPLGTRNFGKEIFELKMVMLYIFKATFFDRKQFTKKKFQRGRSCT